MGAALPIRDDLTPAALRRRARHQPNRRAALRLLAVANALEGMSRAEAARLAGMGRQAPRDAVVRYNAEGPAGLRDRPKQARPVHPEADPEAQERFRERGCATPRGPRPRRTPANGSRSGSWTRRAWAR